MEQSLQDSSSPSSSYIDATYIQVQVPGSPMTANIASGDTSSEGGSQTPRGRQKRKGETSPREVESQAFQRKNTLDSPAAGREQRETEETVESVDLESLKPDNEEKELEEAPDL